MKQFFKFFVLVLMMAAGKVLAQPILISPGAAGGNGTLGGTNVTFQWNAVAGAISYRLQVVRSNGSTTDPFPFINTSGFTSAATFVYNQNVGNNTSQSVFLEKGVSYSWSVRSDIANSPFADRFYMVTRIDPPTLNTPTSGANVTNPVSFSWTNSSVYNAESNRIEISTSSSYSKTEGFTNALVSYPTSGNLGVPNYTHTSNLPNGTYYWIARFAGHTNGVYHTSEFATPQSFIVGTVSSTTVANPTISPSSTTFTGSQSVSISTSTTGANIYYTTDGSNPTSSSTQYSGAFSITATTTVKAIATKPTMTDSGVATETYTLSTGGGGGASLSASPTSLNFDNTGSPARTVNVTASAGLDWDASSNESWITVNGGNGTGDGSFTVSCSNNSGTSPRSGSVKINAMGVSEVTVNVSQDGTPAADVQCIALNAPTTLPRGNTITITAILKNLGGIASTSDSYILRWGTTMLRTETFSLAPNETRNVTYTGRRDDAVGGYIVTISNGLGVMTQKLVNIVNPSVTSTGSVPNPAPADGVCQVYNIGTDAEEWAVVNNLPNWINIDQVTATSFRLCVSRNDLTLPRTTALQVIANQLQTFTLPPVNQAAQPCPTVGGLTICADRINLNGTTRTASGNVRIYRTVGGNQSVALRSVGDVHISSSGIISGSAGLYIENIPNWGTIQLVQGSFSFSVTQVLMSAAAPLNSVFKLAGGKVVIDKVEILSNGIRIDGTFIPMSIYNYTPVTINTLQITLADGVKLNGRICLPDLKYAGVGLTNSCMTFNTTANPKRFDLTTSLAMPILGNVAVEGQVTEACLVPPVNTLPNCSAEINSFFADYTLPSPYPFCGFAALDRVKLSVSNLSKFNRQGTQPKPISISGEADLSSYPDSFMKIKPFRLTYDVGQFIEGSATMNLFNQNMANITVRLTSTELKTKGWLDIYTMVEGNHFSNLNFANRVQFAGSLKGNVKMPSQVTLNQITFSNRVFQYGWDYLKSKVSSGKILGTGASVLTNKISNTKLAIAGNSKTAYKFDNWAFSWNGEFFYKILWKGGTDFNVNLNHNYSEIPVEFQNSLTQAQNNTGGNGSWRTESDKKYAIFYLGDATTDLVIGVEGQTEVVPFSINLPNGKNISTGNVSQYTTIKRTEITDKNMTIYSIGNPINGKYIIEIDAPFSRVYVLRKKNAPSIKLSTITQNAANRTLDIKWEDDDIDSDAIIELGYDNNNSGIDGKHFVDTIRKDNNNNRYVWNYSQVPTGNYYIYALVQDSLGQFSYAYSDRKYKIINPNAPIAPNNLGFNTSDSTIKLFWNASPTQGVEYMVHYANKPNTVDFDSPSFAVGDTTYCNFNHFIAGKYYEFMVTAIDTATHAESNQSNIVSLTYNPVGQNKFPIINETNINTTTRLGVTYNNQIQATDPDSNLLTYLLLEKPTTMNINNNGLITWQPTADDLGYHNIKVRVSDAQGAADSLNYQLFVADFSEPRNHAYFNFNKPLYVNHHDKAQIDLTDLGYNGNMLVKDSVQATISSKSDTQGFKLWFKETEPDSKVFRAEFNFTQTASIANAATLKVVKGDTIFATYRNLNYPKIVSNFAHFTLLEAKFEVTKNPNCASDSVYFKNLSTGTGLTYLWTSDDGTGITSNLQNPIRLFPVNTLREYFVVTLTIKDRLGRTSSYSKSVRRVSKPIVKVVFKNISCKGQIDGSIDLTVLGAFPRFTVKWTHNPALTNWSLRNLAKGTYKAIVTDSVGCQDFDKSYHY